MILAQAVLMPEELQPTHSAANSANFLDTLQQIPRLAQTLLQDSKTANAVGRTCRTAQAVICEHVTSITLLEANGHGTQYQVEAMEKLVKCRWPYLHKLNLKYRATLNDAAVAVLARANWPHLAVLDLSRNNLSASSFSYLIEGRWPKLHTLDLSHNRVGSSGMTSLSEGNWPLLQTLKLNDCHLHGFELSKDAAEKLADRKWQQLQHLELGFNFLSTGVLQFPGTLLSGLTSLDLSRNRLQDDAILGLSPVGLPDLVRLVLAHNLVEDHVLEVASMQWSQLTYLDLSSCYFRRPVLSNCQHLQYLNLAGNMMSFGEQALACLADQLPQLRMLDLSDTDLLSEDMEQLVVQHWPELVELKFVKNTLSAASYSLLCAACGGELFEFSKGANKVKLPTKYAGPWPKLQLITF